MIAMNAARFEMLRSASSAIALLNIINSVLIRHHHNFYFALVSGPAADVAYPLIT